MAAYLVAVSIVVLIYLLLSLGLTVQYGLTGLINFGLIGFFAIGAYTSALLALKGVPLPISFTVTM
jgi:branched-chain amino acid transport system permease protein